MPTTLDRRDAVVTGGGPAGSTAARVLAQAGLDVLVVERVPFPRFHVGESLLPRNIPLFAELGLWERISAMPHTFKAGVEFAFGHAEEPRYFTFSDGLLPVHSTAVNLERGPFDEMLLGAARDAGATVWVGEGVRRIVRLDEGGVELEVGERRIEAPVVPTPPASRPSSASTSACARCCRGCGRSPTWATSRRCAASRGSGRATPRS
jgi:flavin-dependent dehydrogenase